MLLLLKYYQKSFGKYLVRTINIHASLLPQLRGAAPINWAIINGLRKTGITSFYINEGIDTGDIILKKELEISEK